MTSQKCSQAGDYNNSPYYNFFDFYNGTGPTDTLKIIKNFKTIQQSTEWTCGCTAATMVLNHFGEKKVKNKSGDKTITDVYLSYLRQDGNPGATCLSGMKQIFDTVNEKNDSDWVYVGSDSLKEGEDGYMYLGSHALEAGAKENGLIPYLIDKGIPMMIGWDEWGGHWQTIIGYDDMGTEETQDDVLVLADSYDTTDHEQDGYVLESFERLVYGWNAQFEMNKNWGTGEDYYDFIIAFPKEDHEAVARVLGATNGQSK